MATNKVELLRGIIQKVVARHPSFFTSVGAGRGDKASHAFVKEVRAEALRAFGEDCAERRLCDVSSAAVDYCFEDEKTIVQLARLVMNPNSEFHKDILKALLAMQHYKVERLVLLGGPGSRKACSSPARKAIIDWAYAQHGLRIDVYDIERLSDAALPGEEDAN